MASPSPITAFCDYVESATRTHYERWRSAPPRTPQDWTAYLPVRDEVFAKLGQLYVIALRAATGAGYAPAEAEGRLGAMLEAVRGFVSACPRLVGYCWGGTPVYELEAKRGYSPEDLACLKRPDMTESWREAIAADAALRYARALEVGQQQQRNWELQHLHVQPAVNDCRVMAAAAGESAEPEGTDSTFPVKPTAGSDRPAKILSAMALLRTIGPNAAEIARRIGMPRTTLMGCEEFAVAYQGLRRDKADRRDRYRRNHTDPDD